MCFSLNTSLTYLIKKIYPVNLTKHNSKIPTNKPSMFNLFSVNKNYRTRSSYQLCTFCTFWVLPDSRWIGNCLSICNPVSCPSTSPTLCPLCPGLIIHEGSSVYRIFKRWQAVNQQWKVLNYEKAKDLGDPISSSSKGAGRVERNSSHTVTNSGRRASRHVRTFLNHHCGYTILHILSQLRPNNLHSTNHEVVMRVTTVWGWLIYKQMCSSVPGVTGADWGFIHINPNLLHKHCR